MNLEEYLSIPYRLRVYSTLDDEGSWRRYAEYPEIHCIAEGETPVEAMQRLEQRRIDYIRERFHAGEDIPVPRPPLRSLARLLPPYLLDGAVAPSGDTGWNGKGGGA